MPVEVFKGIPARTLVPRFCESVVARPTCTPSSQGVVLTSLKVYITNKAQNRNKPVSTRVELGARYQMHHKIAPHTRSFKKILCDSLDGVRTTSRSCYRCKETP